MTAPGDKLPDDDAELWDRVAKGVKVYEHEGRLVQQPSTPPKSIPKKKAKVPGKPAAVIQAAVVKPTARPVDLRVGIMPA